MSNAARQARLSRLTGSTASDATAAGMLPAKTASVDIVDAHVVITSDAGDLRRLAPRLPLLAI